MEISKQAARWILHIQEDQIVGFKQEGIIPGHSVDELLEEVQHDLKFIRSKAT